MTQRSDTQILEIFGGQLFEKLGIDMIAGEGFRVFAESHTSEPPPDIHRGSPAQLRNRKIPLSPTMGRNKCGRFRRYLAVPIRRARGPLATR